MSEKRRTVREAETKGASAGQRQRPLMGHSMGTMGRLKMPRDLEETGTKTFRA